MMHDKKVEVQRERDHGRADNKQRRDSAGVESRTMSINLGFNRGKYIGDLLQTNRTRADVPWRMVCNTEDVSKQSKQHNQTFPWEGGKLVENTFAMLEHHEPACKHACTEWLTVNITAQLKTETGVLFS